MKRLKPNIMFLVLVGAGVLVYMAHVQAMSGEPLSNAVSFYLGFIAGLGKDILRADREDTPYEKAEKIMSDDNTKTCCKPESEEA